MRAWFVRCSLNCLISKCQMAIQIYSSVHALRCSTACYNYCYSPMCKWIINHSTKRSHQLPVWTTIDRRVRLRVFCIVSNHKNNKEFLATFSHGDTVPIWTFTIVSTIIVLDVLFLLNTDCSLCLKWGWETLCLEADESLKNRKWLSGTLRLVHWSAAFGCINRPTAGEVLFVECPVVVLIFLFQVCQSAILHLAAAFVKADWKCF